MDIWGVGCVFFEILSLFPLFPGNNEKDQIHKIHNILGTPPKDILERYQKHARHIDFNFPHTVGTGINKLIPHISPECQELISKLLIYNPDERITSRQALNSPYFKEQRAQDTKLMTVQRELGPATGGIDDSGEQYPGGKKGLRAGETLAEYPKRRVQQGSNGKRWQDADGDLSNEYDDSVNNVWEGLK